MQETGPDGARAFVERRLAVLQRQMAMVGDTHPDVVATAVDGTAPRQDGQPFGYLFREGRMLVRPDLRDDVTRFVESRKVSIAPVERLPLVAEPGAGAAAVARLAGREISGADLDETQELGRLAPREMTLAGVEPVRGVPELLAAIHDEFGTDSDGVPAASPHHLFFMAGHGPLCPATEPEEVVATDRTYPPRGRADAGYGVEVAVLDSGFISRTAKTCDWLGGVVDWDLDPVDLFDVTTMTDGSDCLIDPYAGHGTFIAGIIGRIAPGAAMHVRRLDIDLRGIMTEWPEYSADIVDELHLAEHIRAALCAGQKVISVSAGGPTRDDHPPLSFAGMQGLFEASEAVLVAAAGNESSDEPFWPARFDWALGVGALDAAGAARADYSNYDKNAKVYAPGTDIVNAYATGRYKCVQPPDEGTIRRFHGRARWSGTSFATPMVAGLVAARMSAQGETAPQAAAALVAIANASHVLPGVGPVLDPGFTDLGV